MSDQYVQVNPDSTGKKVRTNEVTDSLSNVVEQQVVQLADGLGAALAVAPGTPQATAPTQGLMVQGLVNDAPPQSYIDAAIWPLSLTSEGRLRVSTTPAQNAVIFFNQDQEAQWGESPSFALGSPSF